MSDSENEQRVLDYWSVGLMEFQTGRARKLTGPPPQREPDAGHLLTFDAEVVDKRRHGAVGVDRDMIGLMQQKVAP